VDNIPPKIGRVAAMTRVITVMNAISP
jgi:hypothetical protein